MKTKTSILLTSITMLLFSGCSSKTSFLDTTKKPTVDLTQSNDNYSKIEDNNKLKSLNIDSNNTFSPLNNTIEGNNTEIIKDTPLVTEEVPDDKVLLSVYFDYDSYSLKEDMMKILEENKVKIGNGLIKLEGNCDEFGSDEYNFALGLKRANVVKKYLLDNGVKESNISLNSMGESNPVCVEPTQECYAKNRRVDFILVK